MRIKFTLCSGEIYDAEFCDIIDYFVSPPSLLAAVFADKAAASLQ